MDLDRWVTANIEHCLYHHRYNIITCLGGDMHSRSALANDF